MDEETLNQEFIKIEKESYKKMKKGYIRYGYFNPKTCERDLFEEAIEELLDTINYCKMNILKLRRIQSKFKKK